MLVVAALAFNLTAKPAGSSASQSATSQTETERTQTEITQHTHTAHEQESGNRRSHSRAENPAQAPHLSLSALKQQL